MENKIHEELVRDLKKIGKTPLILGKRLRVDNNRVEIECDEYYYPSTNLRIPENLFVNGQAGSGKTWGIANLMGQSFFNEGRTWIIIDTRGVYRCNHLPSECFVSELNEFGLKPRGIPREQMVVCAPEYYLSWMSDEEKERDQITDSYRIPMSMLNFPILFGIAKMSSGYDSIYNIEWKRMLARTKFAPKFKDICAAVQDIITTANAPTSRRYEALLDRLKASKDLVLCEDDHSPIGKALLQTIKDKKPRWIVLTFKHAETLSDPINLAVYASVLEELRRITAKAVSEDKDFRVGLFVDEMQYYVNDKSSNAYVQTSECIYRWGKSNQIARVWSAQRNEHLGSIFRDSINEVKREGVYHQIIHYFRMGGPGYCSYMDRMITNEKFVNLPHVAPYVKGAPPMFQIEE